MAGHLVKHCPLHRKDPPIRLILRVSAVEHVERLLEAAVVGERPTIGAEHDTVLGVLDRRLLQYGFSLRTLADRTQRLGVTDRRLGIARLGAVALAPSIHFLSPLLLG